MPSERANFRPDIEGLRGIAILLVVAFHAGVAWTAGGYVGVDIFFVISGFFITGLLAHEVGSTGDVDLAEFYARRARRLLPAFLLVVLATLGAALWLYAPIDQRSIAADARVVALSSGNILFARTAVNYHAAAENPFLHTWSLAVEEQFYLIWPLLFVVVGRAYDSAGATRRRLIAWVALAGALSFLASLWITRVAQPWAFFGMPTRLWEFAVGGVAALAISREGDKRRGRVLQSVGLASIGFAAVAFHDATPYPGVAARAMLRRILALRPDAVILSSYDHYLPADGSRSASGVTPASWRDGLRRTYGVLSRAGITTLAIRDVPRVGFDVPGCLSRRASNAPFTKKPCEYDRERSLNHYAVQAQTDAARGMRHVALVDMNDRICSGPRCQVVQRGAIVYRDGDHLTATFSEREAAVLGGRIDAVVHGSIRTR